jgi:hypothetical protein
MNMGQIIFGNIINILPNILIIFGNIINIFKELNMYIQGDYYYDV